jgi:hypothetical protein
VLVSVVLFEEDVLLAVDVLLAADVLLAVVVLLVDAVPFVGVVLFVVAASALGVSTVVEFSVLFPAAESCLTSHC